MATTSRWGLHYPEGTDAADVPKWMKELAMDLDGVAMDDQGLKSARPTSTAEKPGKKGRYYFATDEKILYRDNGTGWEAVGGAAANNSQGKTSERPAASLAGRVFYATDTEVTYRDTGTAWVRTGGGIRRALGTKELAASAVTEFSLNWQETEGETKAFPDAKYYVGLSVTRSLPTEATKPPNVWIFAQNASSLILKAYNPAAVKETISVQAIGIHEAL